VFSVSSAYLERAKTLLQVSSPEQTVKHICSLVGEHDRWRSLSCINLHAAESAISPVAERLLSSDLSRRAFLGEIGNRLHSGARYLDEIDALTVELARKLFGADYVEYRPVTASAADGLALRCLTDVGDTILALEKPRGHATWREEGFAGYRSLKILDIPFDYEEWNIDVNRLAQLVDRIDTRLKLMIIGTSLFLFPHPLKEMREMADEMEAKIWYDGAHILGLWAGGQFQDPLREGADLVTGSTQKTLSGPLGGLMLHNDGELDKKIHSFFYGHFSTIGHNRTAALAVTLAEMLEFGKDFAKQMITNAKALAKALDEEGLNVMCKRKGYTETQTVAFDAREEVKKWRATLNKQTSYVALSGSGKLMSLSTA
jgi:glycine hydroxymethyltransferase